MSLVVPVPGRSGSNGQRSPGPGDKAFGLLKGEAHMANQFVNPQEEKAENMTDTNESTEKKVDRIAEKAAEKAAKTQQKNEKDHPIFSE
jgi:hypothetical protein